LLDQFFVKINDDYLKPFCFKIEVLITMSCVFVRICGKTMTL